MPQVDLQLLAEKYKSCVTCRHRIMKQHKGKDHMAWCVQHRRPIRYDTYKDAKGGTWALDDHPCDDWIYQARPIVLSVQSKAVGAET